VKTNRIENKYISLTIDNKESLYSLKNKLTSTEIITYPEEAKGWEMVIPTGRHTIERITSKEQIPDETELRKDKNIQSITLSYNSIKMRGENIPVKIRFTLSIGNSSKKIIANISIDNKSNYSIDEVEFPMIGGVGGFSNKDKIKTLNLAAGNYYGQVYSDILNGLPVTHPDEGHHFVYELETAFFLRPYSTFETNEKTFLQEWKGSSWIDMYSEDQGLLFSLHGDRETFFFVKLEKYPKEVPNIGAHMYPEGTRRWVRANGVHLCRIKPGDSWNSWDVVIMPHKGDWHIGADFYATARKSSFTPAKPPKWMNDFIGWTEITGKHYTGEINYDYKSCAEAVIRDKEVTGIDVVFYYGHTKLGCEGADFDHMPSSDLGGEKEFKKMVDKLHQNGIKIILLDHFHRWINQDIPEYKELGLEKYAILDRNGNPRVAKWCKDTALSTILNEGPTPVWIEMCPSCEKWLEYYLNHVSRMIKLGVDGLELDTFNAHKCFNSHHNHKTGDDMFLIKRNFTSKVREFAKRMNPEFALIGETMVPEQREELDGYYAYRYYDENDIVYRYMFPELRQQSVLVGTYSYDQVNKALQLGIGAHTEIWGLRKTCLEGAPELAEYIGEVNRFKRKYPDTMIHGLFRDTVGAKVDGEVYYSVLEGPGESFAIVIRNPNKERVNARVLKLSKIKDKNFILWKPFCGEKNISEIPEIVDLDPFGVAVILVLDS